MSQPLFEQAQGLVDRLRDKGAAALMAGTLAIGALGGAAFSIAETDPAYADGATGATGTTGANGTTGETGTTRISGSPNPLAGNVDNSSPDPNCPYGVPGLESYWCREWNDDFQVQLCQSATLRQRVGGRPTYFIDRSQAIERSDSDEVSVSLKLHRPSIGLGNSEEECAQVTDNSVEIQLAIAKSRSGHVVLKDLQPVGRPTRPIFGNNSVVYDGNPDALTNRNTTLKVGTKAEKTALQEHKLYIIDTVNSYPLIQVPVLDDGQFSIPGPMVDKSKEIFSLVHTGK